MSGTHFYIALPSNASFSTFPDNTTSYRVELPQPIDVNGHWEVGLYSVAYPYTWYNLQEHESHIYYSSDGHFFFNIIR